MAARDKAFEQLNEYKESKTALEQLTTALSVPIGDENDAQTVDQRGSIVMKCLVFFDEMAHFLREGTPERVIHAKGAGAHGYFEITHDITKYCKAKVFERIGKKTPLFARFSTVAGELGSADTVRDPRGFALKFYTEEGNWDLVGNNTPIFFIRDPMLFPSFIHSQKRNPKTGLKDPDMFWDFISLRPETTHQVSFVFSDRGIPDGFRHMHGYGSHTFKLVNAKGEAVYCKFHHRTDQGIKNLSASEAKRLVIDDDDYATRDLYNAIASGNFPSWTLNIQVMTFEEAKKCRWNPFDVTKTWPQKEFPLIPVGRFVLNRNPQNYFAEVEQSAFSPTHMVPGIEPSPDKMLQGRLFSYPDTQRYRLGVNYLQIPINNNHCPFSTKVGNCQRAGPMCFADNKEGSPNYFPKSPTSRVYNPKFLDSEFSASGDVARYSTADDDNFSQVQSFWRDVLTSDERSSLVTNIADSLRHAQEFIQKRAIRNFSQVDPEYGGGIQKILDHYKKESKAEKMKTTERLDEDF